MITFVDVPIKASMDAGPIYVVRRVDPHSTKEQTAILATREQAESLAKEWDAENPASLVQVWTKVECPR